MSKKTLKKFIKNFVKKLFVKKLFVKKLVDCFHLYIYISKNLQKNSSKKNPQKDLSKYFIINFVKKTKNHQKIR